MYGTMFNIQYSRKVSKSINDDKVVPVGLSEQQVKDEVRKLNQNIEEIQKLMEEVKKSKQKLSKKI